MNGEKFWKPLLAIEALGAVMFAVVCAAYIFGLPKDEVLHKELAYRIAIGVFGLSFFAGSAAMLTVAIGQKRKRA